MNTIKSKARLSGASRRNVVIAAAAVATLALLPATAASAEAWGWGALDCGSVLVLTSGYGNGSTEHIHKYGGTTRKTTVPVPSGTYTWTYYNSGYTAVSEASISAPNLSNGSRSCDW